MRSVFAVAALVLLISCHDDVTGPTEEPPLLQTGSHAIVLTSSPSGPLADPLALTFTELLAAYDSVAEADTVIVGMPIAGLPATSPISIGRGIVEINESTRTVSFAGAAPFRGSTVVFALVGVWEENESVPDFMLLIRVDALSLAAIVPGVAGTMLEELTYGNAAVVLSEADWSLPDSVPEAVRQLAPGLAEVTAGASFLGSFEAPAMLSRAVELIPSVAEAVPRLEGGFGLLAATVLADPGTVSVGALDGLELAGELPVPGEPIGALRVVSHELSALWIDDGVRLTLNSDVTLDIDGAERPFEFLTRIDAHGAGAAELSGRLAAPWPDPFGLEWLRADSLTLRISGSAENRGLRLDATARVLEEFAADLAIDTDVPELRFQLTGALDAAALARLVNGTSRLTGDAEVGIPAGGPTLREVGLTVRPEHSVPVVIEGKGTLLGDVEAGALLTLVRVDEGFHPLFAFHLGPGLLGTLVPPLRGSSIDEAVPGGTIVVPISDDLRLSVPRDSLAPAAHAFFESAWAGLSATSVEIAPVLRLDAPFPLADVPPNIVTLLGLDRSGHALLGGSIGVTLAVLTGTPSLNLDSLSLHASVPFAGAPTGLPDWLAPRRHAFSYRWTRQPEVREFALQSDLRARFTGDSLDLTLHADLDLAHSTLALEGRAGEWNNPWGLHWLSVDSLRLLVQGEAVAANVDLAADLTVAGIPAHMKVGAASDGRAELSVTVEPELTFAGVAGIAGELGGVEAAVTVELPEGGPSLHEVQAVVRPGATTPFSLMATGGLRNDSIQIRALLTLVKRGADHIPVLVLRTNATTLGTIAPSLRGTTLDLELPASAITLPALSWPGSLTVSAAELPAMLRDSLASVFGSGGSFDLRIESVLRLDAPVPLRFIPEAVGRALALNRSGEARLGGALGMNLSGLTAGTPAVDSVTLFAVIPRQGSPQLLTGWPDWLALERDSMALYWRREPAASELTVRSRMTAELGGAHIPFAFVTHVASEDGDDRVELRGRAGRWEHPFGISWLNMDTVGLRLDATSESMSAELGSAIRILDRSAGLHIGVTDAGTAELELTLGALSVDDVVTLMRNQWPGLGLPESFPGDITIEESFLYLRTGDVTGFSIGGRADFFDQRARALVSVATTGGSPLVLAGFGVEDFNLSTLLRDAGVGLNEDAESFLDNFSFENAAIQFSSADVALADSVLDPRALEFFNAAFGSGPFEMTLRNGITAVARRPLTPGGSLDEAMDVLAAKNPDRSMTVSGYIPGRYLFSGRGGDDALEFNLRLPRMAPRDSSEWFRHGQLSLQLKGPPSISIGLVGDLGITVDDHDLDFDVTAALQAGGGGSLRFSAAASAESKDWVAPFGQDGLTLRRLGLDLLMGAVEVGMCVGGDISIGAQDVRGAIGVMVNNLTGAPTGGLLYAGSNRGVALEDLTDLQASMFGNDPLGVSALPPMRLDTFDILMARPNPGTVQLECVPDNITGNLAVRGNLWGEFPAGSGMQLLGWMDFSFSTRGITAKGELASGHIGPVAWVDPRLDLELNLGEQHLIVSGGASIGGALDVDSLLLYLTRDSLAFATSMELAHGVSAEIFAAAAPDLIAPDFDVHGQVEGAYVQQLSAELYARLGYYSEQGHLLLDRIRSNSTGFDLDAAIAAATAAESYARTLLKDADDMLLSLRGSRSQCRLQICRLRYDAQIAIWENIRKVRVVRHQAAESALALLLDSASYAASVSRALALLDHWIDNNRIVLTDAGFHTDLEHLLSRSGLEVHVNGSIDGAPLHLTVDLNAGLAHNVASLVRAALPAELSALLES